MASPWQTPRARRLLRRASKGGTKRRWRLPGGLTGNALLTAVIAALVSGAISFYVAHWQSQDAARQAAAGQQVQALIQLETDSRTFYEVDTTAYISRRQCADRITSACGQTYNSISDSPLISAEDTLSTDVANVSDAKAKSDVERMGRSGLDALAQDGTAQGENAWTNMNNEYYALLIRCGQLIQGQ
jgi:hypothetical protein